MQSLLGGARREIVLRRNCLGAPSKGPMSESASGGGVRLSAVPGNVCTALRPYRSPVVRRLITANALFFFFLLPFAGLVQKSWAQALPSDSSGPQSLAQLSLEQLGNVEVTTVSKGPQEVMKTPAAVYVITQEDIRRSGATSIPEALRLAPGVQVSQIDGNNWSVSIRGFAGQFSKDLLVLVDGRSVYTPLFEGVYWDIPYVMLEDVDRIEVIRGPGGTIWGSNAVNGVINIITKSANDTHGVLATAGSGTVDQGTGAFRYGGTAGKSFDYRIYGMGGIRGQEEHPDGDGFDHWRMGQMGFRTDWKSGQKDTFTVQGDLYRGESGESILHRLVQSSGGDGGAGLRLPFRWEPAGALAAHDGRGLRHSDPNLFRPHQPAGLRTRRNARHLRRRLHSAPAHTATTRN